jgi:hypothetical protein
LKWLASWISDDAAMISISGLAQAASGPASGRAHQPLAARIGADGGGQHAGNRSDRAVEPELAKHSEARERIVRDGADRGHQPERDRQIVMTAFLGQIGGRQIDGDASRRQRESGRDQSRAHALARFGDRFIGKTDNVEGDQAGRHLHLDIDRPDLDALKRHCGDALDHVSPCPNGQTNGTFWPVKNI